MSPDEIARLIGGKYVPERVRDDLHAQREQYLSTAIIPSDIIVYSGRGSALQTNKGELIDLASMTVNCILGQNDPWVNGNLIAYLLSGRPSFLTTRLGSDLYYRVANRMLTVSGWQGNVINHRQSNGSDVMELAILAAYNERPAGRSKLVSFEGSYHGQSLTAYHVSDLQKKHRFLVHDSPVIFLDQPTPAASIDDDSGLAEQDRATLQQLENCAHEVFAVVLEPIQVNNSVTVASKAFMQELRRVCTEHGIALIFDEVQTGWGWLGAMTAAERYGVKPDLFGVSKALTAGNGPLSALISTRKYQAIPDGTSAKTNGADIRSLVAADAVMDRLLGIPASEIPDGLDDTLAGELQAGLLSTFGAKQVYLEKHLWELHERHDTLVKSVRGDGLIRGVELVDAQGEYDEKKTRAVQYELMQRGVLVRHHDHTLIVKPPIVTTEAQFDRAFEIIDSVLKEHE